MTVDANLSSRINIMRIVLISGIVFVHVPYDAGSSAYLGTYGAFDWLRVFLAEAMFRIGVPCLSAISGYLLFRNGMEKFDYLKTLKSKIRTVALPFLFWNGAFALFAVAVLAAGIGDGYMPNILHADARAMMTHLLALEDFPVNIPLYFLRDLFVCILLSPLLAAAIKRAPFFTLTALLVLALLPYISIYIVLKRTILFSFSLGIYFALYKVDLKALDRYAPVGAALTLAAAALLATAIYWNGSSLPSWLEASRNALAVFGAAGFWLSSALIARSTIGERLAHTGSLSFWIFCGHYPILLCFWIIWGKANIDFYPAFFVFALIALFSVLIISNAFVRARAPALYGLLTGGRSGKARPIPAEPLSSPELAPQQR